MANGNGNAANWNGKTGVFALLGGCAALVTIHTLIVVPGVLGMARKEFDSVIRQNIEAHARQPHANAVSQRELTLILNQLATLEQNLSKRLDSIEERIKGKE